MRLPGFFGILYPMAAKKFRTGPQPGSSVPTRVMTRDPKQNIHHSKALHASNPTVGHSSKSVKYEPSYGHLNFHYSSVPLYYKQLKILKNQFLVCRSKVFYKRCYSRTDNIRVRIENFSKGANLNRKKCILVLKSAF